MEKPTETPSRRRPWSLYFFIAWALILTFNTGLFLWDITGPLAQFGMPNNLFGWLSLAVAFLTPFGFGASVYGLWERWKPRPPDAAIDADLLDFCVWMAELSPGMESSDVLRVAGFAGMNPDRPTGAT